MAEIRDHFIGISIFVIVVLCGISIITLINSGDPNGDGSDAIPNLVDQSSLNSFNRSVNVANKLNDDIVHLSEAIANLKPKLDLVSIITLPVAFVQTGWATISFIIDSFSLMTTPLSALSGFLGIPEFVVNIVVGMLSLILIFGVLGLIFGKEF
jgi:hypothetical protein